MTSYDAHRDDTPLHTDLLAHSARGAQARLARQELFERVSPALYAWFALHLRGPLRQQFDVEDLLQETTLRALESLANWRVELGSFRQYYFGIAKNLLAMALRRRSRDPSRPRAAETSSASQQLDPATTLTRAVARDEELLELVKLLEALPDEDRSLVLHRGLEGLPHDEVARILGVSVDAAQKRWQRLCERLRDHPRWQALQEPGAIT